jgi:hypothetical protein
MQSKKLRFPRVKKDLGTYDSEEDEEGTYFLENVN